MWIENRYIGANELILVFRNGTYYVLEEYENYNSIFQGNYKKCIEYMKTREIDYLESLL